MRVLLDECLPRGLGASLAPSHEVTTVPERGWSGKKNGDLLRLAAGQIDAFITIDAGLEYQQNLAGVPFAVVLLSAPSNRLAVLQPLMTAVLEQLATAEAGQIIRIAVAPPEPG